MPEARSSQRGPLRVLWLCKGLGAGGMERLLVNHARMGDRSTFHYEVAYLVPAKDQLVPELEALGVPCTCLDASSDVDVAWYARLRALVADHRIDIVHAHSPAAAVGARLACRTLRRRPTVVYTEHNSWEVYRWPTRLANLLTYPLDDAQLAVSQAAFDSVPGRLRRRLEVLAHGIDLDEVRAQRVAREEVRKELEVGDDELLVGTVANFRPEKNYEGLLRVADAVTHEGGVVVVSVGSGPLEAELRALHASLGLGDRFRFLGHRRDAVRVMSGFDLFVMSSHMEGLPVAFMEARALGLPVVVTAVGGLAEQVHDGLDGLAVPPGDDDALAGAIERVLGDPALRARLASESAAAASAFDAARSVASIEALYRKVAQRRRGRARGAAARRRVGAPTVLHLITSSDRRGAEVFAVRLAEELGGAPRNEVVAIAPGARGERLDVAALGTRRADPLGWLRLVRRLRRADVLVAHGSSALLHGASAAWVARRPFIYRNIGDPDAWRAVRGADLRIGLPLRRAAAVAALYPAAAAQLVDAHRLDPERVTVVPNAVPAFDAPSVFEQEAARRRLGLGDDLDWVGFVGALSEEKGVLDAIRAVASDPALGLLVVGDGPQREEAGVLADSLAPGRVRFHGVTDDPIGVMSAVDAVVLPSRTEGIPAVAIEAAMCGVPVVATAVGGMASVVVDGETGVLVETPEVQELAAGLRRAIRHRDEMGEAGRRRCLERFSMAQVARDWQQLIERVAGEA